MTTVAYRDGVLAGDTMVSDGTGCIICYERKVYKLSDGCLYGYAGGVEEGQRLLHAIKRGDAPPSLGDTEALLIMPNRKVYLYEGNMWIKQTRQPYIALGTGGTAAYGAMDAGADAETAANIGVKRDNKSGGKVLVVRLDKEQKRKND
jgi:ATP-dependent protease HslVU (ClpYQ) peptidase subunit